MRQSGITAMSKRLSENCDSPNLDESNKDAELVPKDFPYLKRLLAEIDQLKERKPLPLVSRSNTGRKNDPSVSASKRVTIRSQKHAR